MDAEYPSELHRPDFPEGVFSNQHQPTGSSRVIGMIREKRSEIVRARITPKMRQQLELDLREKSNVLSISDYLYEMLEQRFLERSMGITRVQVGKRIGNQ